MLGELLNEPDVQFLAVKTSPILEATPECSKSLLENYYKLEQHHNVCRRMTKEEVLKLIEMPAQVGKAWFDELVVRNESVFSDVAMNTLKKNWQNSFLSYFNLDEPTVKTFDSVVTLDGLELNEDTKKKIRGKLFASNDTERQPIRFDTFLFKINLTMGSRESLDFHKALSDHGATELFKSAAIRHIIDYKWSTCL